MVMPVYNEDSAVTAGLLATLGATFTAWVWASGPRSLSSRTAAGPMPVLREMAAISRLRDVSPVPVWYRRRRDNHGRKAGNVADFVRRWGGRYDQMVVLDADSMVGAATIKALSGDERGSRHRPDPDHADAGRRPDDLARVTQFAGRIYGPAIARGVSAWSGDSGNFWGHNAILRVSAFAQCCGLPELPGRPPLWRPFSAMTSSRRPCCAAPAGRCGWTTTCAKATRAAPRCWTWPCANAAGRRATCNMRG